MLDTRHKMLHTRCLMIEWGNNKTGRTRTNCLLLFLVCCGLVFGQDSLRYFKVSDRSYNEEIILSHKPIYEASCLAHSPIGPRVFFEKNSLNFNNSLINNDSVIAIVVSVMKRDKFVSLTIKAHADTDEQDQKRLSQLRVKKIKSILMKNGVSGKRITTESCGTEYPLINSIDIDRMDTEKEREKAKATNRRCVFSFVGGTS